SSSPAPQQPPQAKPAQASTPKAAAPPKSERVRQAFSWLHSVLKPKPKTPPEVEPQTKVPARKKSQKEPTPCRPILRPKLEPSPPVEGEKGVSNPDSAHNKVVAMQEALALSIDENFGPEDSTAGEDQPPAELKFSAPVPPPVELAAANTAS